MELNEVGLQNTINTTKWFKQSFNSMHITSDGYTKWTLSDQEAG